MWVAACLLYALNTAVFVILASGMVSFIACLVTLTVIVLCNENPLFDSKCNGAGFSDMICQWFHLSITYFVTGTKGNEYRISHTDKLSAIADVYNRSEKVQQK